MNDKTIIELGCRKISWFVDGSQINYLPLPLANNWSARHRQITIFCSTSSNNWLLERAITYFSSHCIQVPFILKVTLWNSMWFTNFVSCSPKNATSLLYQQNNRKCNLLLKYHIFDKGLCFNTRRSSCTLEQLSLLAQFKINWYMHNYCASLSEAFNMFDRSVTHCSWLKKHSLNFDNEFSYMIVIIIPTSLGDDCLTLSSGKYGKVSSPFLIICPPNTTLYVLV